MAASRWLQVDDNSWPLQSTRYPNLTVTAYAPDAVYTHEDIAALTRYAFERGISIVPEFDGERCDALTALHAVAAVGVHQNHTRALTAAKFLLVQCLPMPTRGLLRCPS